MAYQREKVKARQVVTPNTQTQTLGVVANVPMGDWNATTPYQKLNMVRYNGATYIATQANTNIAPTTSSVWQLVNTDGRGVQSASVTYQEGDTANTPPLGSWTATVPTVAQGKYLWTRIVFEYADTSTTTAYSVVREAVDGNAITSTDIAYQASVSGTTPPTGEWVTAVPNVPQGQYLWTRTTTHFSNTPDIVSYGVSLQGLNFTQQDRNDLTRIEGAIPSTASAQNPLADKAFVNSSINAVAAFYITRNAQGDAFPTKAALVGATTFYSGGKVRIPTQNDYATVLADETQSGATTRYTYQTDTQNGTYPNGQWDLSFVVNSTSFTQAQLDAMNSGVTAEKLTAIDNDLTNKLDKVTTTVSDGSYRTYIITADGGQAIKSVSSYQSPNSVTFRTYEGTVRTATPTNNNDATTKAYVDSADSALQTALDDKLSTTTGGAIHGLVSITNTGQTSLKANKDIETIGGWIMERGEHVYSKHNPPPSSLGALYKTKINIYYAINKGSTSYANEFFDIQIDCFTKNPYNLSDDNADSNDIYNKIISKINQEYGINLSNGDSNYSLFSGTAFQISRSTATAKNISTTLYHINAIDSRYSYPNYVLTLTVSSLSATVNIWQDIIENYQSTDQTLYLPVKVDSYKSVSIRIT